MELAEFTRRMDEELRTEDYADLDASPNGLQIGPGTGDVERVAFAVDAAVATIEAAVEADADLLVTHHGVVWGGVERVTGQHYRRVAPLVRAGLPLYVSHLPLDGHQTLGNAAGVADHLGLEDREPFGMVGPEPIGQRGRLPDPTGVETVRARLDELDQGDRSTQVLPFGPAELTDVAVVTGSGADYVADAAAAGVDALVTGEGKQQLYHEARETETTVFLAGHYATETFGVRALAELASSWGLESVFVSHPTEL